MLKTLQSLGGLHWRDLSQGQKAGWRSLERKLQMGPLLTAAANRPATSKNYSGKQKK